MCGICRFVRISGKRRHLLVNPVESFYMTSQRRPITKVQRKRNEYFSLAQSDGLKNCKTFLLFNADEICGSFTFPIDLTIPLEPGEAGLVLLDLGREPEEKLLHACFLAQGGGDNNDDFHRHGEGNVWENLL